jgi:hypothetical protein
MIQPRLFGQPQTELSTDDYYTPAWIFDELGLYFDLDVASPPGGPPFVPCDRYYTQLEDGLSSEWFGRVWMNPPFSNPAPWVHRWLEHGNGVALLPMAKGSRWLDTLWNSDAGLVVTRRVRFHRGDTTTEISFPTAIWAIGKGNLDALARLGKVR